MQPVSCFCSPPSGKEISRWLKRWGETLIQLWPVAEVIVTKKKRKIPLRTGGKMKAPMKAMQTNYDQWGVKYYSKGFLERENRERGYQEKCIAGRTLSILRCTKQIIDYSNVNQECMIINYPWLITFFIETVVKNFRNIHKCMRSPYLRCCFALFSYFYWFFFLSFVLFK